MKDILSPDKIYVTGFPFMLQGWNGVYDKTNIFSDGYPVYKLSTNIFTFLTVNSMLIFREDSKWHFKREGDKKSHLFKNIYNKSDNRKLYGSWKLSLTGSVCIVTISK